MKFAALGLIFISAFVHLGWNILAKDSKDKLSFLWLALFTPSLIGVAVVAYKWQGLYFSKTAYICLALTGLTHAIYFWALANAYKFGDLSFVYPYFRGVGVVITVIIGHFYFAEDINYQGYMGISLCLIGIVLEPIFSRNAKKKLNIKAVIFTLLTGVSVAAFLSVDKVGVLYVDIWVYVFMMFILMHIGLTPIVLKSHSAKEELKLSRYRPVIAGLCMTVGYILVLYALTMIEVSYVAAVRAIGVVFGGIAGYFIFKEKVSLLRMLGISSIVLGIVMIGLA